MPQSQSLTAAQKIAITLLLALILWLPRGLMLNRFVAVDERSWLTRSGNFYLALRQGDFADTFQRYHPGVTTMWLGMAGFLWRYPEYASDAAAQIGDMSEGVEGFLRAQGHEPIDLLAGGRTFVVLATLLALLVAFWAAVDLFGLLAALAGFLLIAFEPFLLGLTRMLHVDGLSSAFMLLSLIAFLRYQAGSPADRPAYAGRTRDLVISAGAAGLAWLTKSPALFLIPFMGLMVTHAVWQRWRADGTEGWRYLLRPVLDGLLWLALAALVFVLLWPAMWVQPVESLRLIFSRCRRIGRAGPFQSTCSTMAAPTPATQASGSIRTPFCGAVSPVTLIGLVLGLAAWIMRRPPLDSASRRRTLTWLLLFALLFILFMTLGAKKFPRYLLPVYMPLGLVAGVGWAALGPVDRRACAPALGSRRSLSAPWRWPRL